jgi:hypothetical protein
MNLQNSLIVRLTIWLNTFCFAIKTNMKPLFLILCLLPLAGFCQVSNNEPCSALTVPVSQGAGFCQNTAFVLSGATFNPSYPANGCPLAPQSPTPADVWFKFVVPASGNVKIYTSFLPGSPEEDGVMTAYATPTNCSDILNIIGCDDDAGTGVNNLMPVLVLSGRQPNDTIFIQFYLYSGGSTGSFNICVTDPTPPLATQNVGIGLSAPDSTLDVNGNTVIRGAARVAGNLKVSGNTIMNGALAISGGTPGAGKVLTSDATGNASWQVPAIPVGNGTSNQTLRHNGTSWVGNSILTNDGTTVTVAGGLRYTSSVFGLNKVLTSDAAGNATWQTPTAQSNLASGFAARSSVNTVIPTNAGFSPVKMAGFTERFDDGSLFNTTTSEYTAATAGLYHFDADITWIFTAYAGSQEYGIALFKNGVAYPYTLTDFLPYTAGGFITLQRGSFTLKLAVADKIDLRVYQKTGQSANVVVAEFTGYKIY